MKNIKIIPVSCSFQVPLTEKQWNALNAIDNTESYIHDIASGYETKEIKKLMKNGCYNLNYNEHFGRNLFFDASFIDVQKTHKAIKRFLKILDKQ
jgi:hypothetical protein